ncbi:uncharacterized protein TNCV_3240371 [Trichonephila clavipes]|nr:uncharacterized protein TNCV_3240371 [Trichonephila clavipes]
MKPLLGDCKLKIHDTVKDLQLPESSVFNVLQDHLLMRKLCSKSVPRLTTVYQKQHCIDDSERCLELLERKKIILRRYVTMDVTWIHYYMSESNVIQLIEHEHPNPVSQKAYDRINAKIADISEALANASMKKAAAEKKKIIDRTVNSVVVNGDGTWKTRGHTSLIGVCALIGADCGKVLDMEVMSSYCKGCDSDKGPKLGPKYSAFLAKHHIFCRKNHSRSAGKMEVCGMQKTFLRSEQKHGLKYQRYIGDGDSKTFLSIAEKNNHMGIVFPL